ncbi:MAG: DUF4215 domain-containing protein [Myxococcales bacterium]|nr:DUF4215 domain-containing protein [Myxococcales bacterium]
MRTAGGQKMEGTVHTITHRKTRIATLAALGTLLPTLAAAQVVAPDTGRCINAINKGMRKVTLAAAKELRACVKKKAGDLLGPQSVTQCIAAAPGVQKATMAALISADNSCSGAPPAFGPTSVTLHGTRAVEITQAFLQDLLGANPDAVLATNSLVMACQSALLKASAKCEDLRINSFNKCKKEGLKRGFVGTAVQLQTVCLGTGTTQPDPTGGKMASACVTAPAAKIQSACVGRGVALEQAFPGCGATTAAGVAKCADERLRCRVCNLLNDVDGLSRDCDLFDDGNDDNESCAEPPECGDADVEVNEGCDDGNHDAGDGCSPTCEVEAGWSCSGVPSACAPVCGDGIVSGGEACDDGNSVPGDGCSSACQVEAGYTCVDSPSTCSPVCGDGLRRPGEACDDGGLVPGDGCSATCTIEPGWTCNLNQPSGCSPTCGDGLLRGAESCDDHNLVSGDGCSATCQTEVGWQCGGEPSTCHTVCGDGIIKPGEACDDGGLDPGDGCSASCTIESGWLCAGQPSHCSTVCGDGLLRGGEECDDHNLVSGDGCSAVCTVETGYTCTGQPSGCSAVCGNGVLSGTEACDDGNLDPGDGCNATCTIETGWTCEGEPSGCEPICGDGLLRGDEKCDDHNANVGDGCNALCRIEPGFVCSGEPSTCTAFGITITSPTHGIFTTASTVTVTGVVHDLPPAQASLAVNGSPVTVAQDGSFSTSVALSATNVFNPIRARVVDTANGSAANARVVVIRGASIADGANSPSSIGLRITDSGLDTVEPLMAQLAGSGLDLGALVPVGTVLINNECFADSFLGCLGRATVTINNPPPSFQSFAFNADSMTNFVRTVIRVNDIRVNVYLSGTGVVPSCDIAIHANQATFTGDYTMSPMAGDPSNIDVNQQGDLGVSFTAFTTSYGGTCDLPIVGSIIQAFLPDLESLTVNAMKNYLSDPDGAGPQDGPIGNAIEDALAGIQIAGPVGDALSVNFESPLNAVNEDVNGITLISDGKFTSSVGSGPGQCQPPVGAPNLTASLAVNEGTPSFPPANTPIGNTPYGLAIGVSTEAFNQLLKAQTECGLLVTSITTLDLGTGDVPLTADVLALIMPEFAIYPPSTLFRIDVRPTLAPIVLAQPGPSNELTTLKLAQLLVSIVKNDGSGVEVLRGAVDAKLGMNFAFANGGLEFNLSTPATSDITVAVLKNPLGVNEAALEQDVLPPLIATLIPSLAGGLGSFPLPQFFGLDLSGLEVTRAGEFLDLYVRLVPAP